MRKLFLIALCSGLVLIACGIVYAALFVGPASLSKTPDSSGAQGENKIQRPIPAAVVQAVLPREFRQFPGSVRANKRVDLKFAVEGKLRELNAQEGRGVRKGEVLARLDQRDFCNQRDAAKAKDLRATKELKRFKRLLRQNVVTLADYEEVETAADVARAELGIKEKALEDTVLYAPFDGVVVKRQVELFEHLKAEQEVLSLQDISRIEVVVQVPERIIARAGAAGLERLQVRFDADPGDRWFNAGVRECGLESDEATRTYAVVITLPPPPGLRVFPGMTATVRAQLRKPERAETDCRVVRVPAAALWSVTGEDSYVWIIAPQGGAPKRQRVRLTALSGDSALLCDGPLPGELVAVAGLRVLSEEQPVRPMRTGKEGLDG